MAFDGSKTRWLGGWLFGLAWLAIVGPAASRAAGAEKTVPRVLATTTVVADLMRQVAGDRVAVDVLMGPGIDPHGYKATPRDADRLARADLVVASGLHLEGKLGELRSETLVSTNTAGSLRATIRSTSRLISAMPASLSVLVPCTPTTSIP